MTKDEALVTSSTGYNISAPRELKLQDYAGDYMRHIVIL